MCIGYTFRATPLNVLYHSTLVHPHIAYTYYLLYTLTHYLQLANSTYSLTQSLLYIPTY